MSNPRAMKVGWCAGALAALLLPNVAFAQAAIAGIVKDSSGGVLPGVSVEAKSPALIEGIRSAVTDGQGLFRVVDLRPGAYEVTFSLPGFNSVTREGIELTALFTATVNVELSVGTLNEAIRVVADSPIVDTHNVVRRESITAKEIDALPSARSATTLAALIPGVVVTGGTAQASQDVGGSAGDRNKAQIHGSRPTDWYQTMDGLAIGALSNGSATNWTQNPGEVAEYSYELGAASAENPYGGVRMNIIPKDGGNLFSGSLFGNFTDDRLQGSNLDDALMSQGLTSVNRVKLAWEVNPSVGGPIKENKLWFFGSYRYHVADEWVAGMYYDLNPEDYIYTPDLSRQATRDGPTNTFGGRLTWQASLKNRLSIYGNHQPRYQDHFGITATRAPEATSIQKVLVNRMLIGTWRSTLSANLLLEAGVQALRTVSDYGTQEDLGVTMATVQVTDQTTGFVFRGPNANLAKSSWPINMGRFATSYVTGAHAAKAGVDFRTGAAISSTVSYPVAEDGFGIEAGGISSGYGIRIGANGRPNQVTLFNTPRIEYEEYTIAALYAQDQWTLKRMTVSGGLRFDYIKGRNPAVHLAAGPFVPAREFPAVENVPNWKDISPRLGLSYDLFGNGRTALKVTVNRYVAQETFNYATLNNPVNTAIASATRAWIDANGDYIPQESELGPLSDSQFGGTRITTRYDDATRSGWGKREYNWEFAASAEHELRPGVSLALGYARRTFGNFLVTDNLAITPADFEPYCITAPADARLPGGGGNQICGLYDLNPSKFGQVNNLVTYASNYGTQRETYEGLDITTNLRLPAGITIGGGLSTGTMSNLGSATQNRTERCFVVDSPQEMRHCETPTPWRTQVKFSGSVPLPWSFEAAGSFQSIPGTQVTGTWAVPNAAIAPSLGRSLSGGATAQVGLVQPGTMFADGFNQVDLRFAKSLRLGQTRLKAMVDLYNALNGNGTITLNQTYGPAWQRPTYVLPSRVIKMGAQVDF